jgi:serpin B
LAGCGPEVEFPKPPPSTTRLPNESDAPNYDRLNDVAFGLARTMDLGGNVVVSPLSVGHNLAVLMDGSTSKTRDELLHLFDLTESTKDAFDESQRALLNRFDSVRGSPLQTANAVFLVWPVALDAGYVERVGKRYGGVVKRVGGATIEGQRLINEWVGERTEGRIPELLVGLSPEEAVLVVNVAHFQDEWARKFDPDETKTGPWKGGGGGDVPLMSQTGTFPHYEDELFQAVKLPYTASEFAFVALLPQEDKSVADVVAALDGKRWRAALGAFDTKSGRVVLPRFSARAELSLQRNLEAMGVRTMFTRDANFRHMSLEMERGFFVARVVHKVVLDVDETGTRASAATATSLAASAETESFEFVADRPFVYAVVETQTGVVCFLGVVNDPSEG